MEILCKEACLTFCHEYRYCFAFLILRTKFVNNIKNKKVLIKVTEHHDIIIIIIIIIIQDILIGFICYFGLTNLWVNFLHNFSSF